MLNAKWITIGSDLGLVCPIFKKDFAIKKELSAATLRITARGVYEAKINGKRVGDFIMAPGYTLYKKRIQVQSFDVTDLLEENNSLEVELSEGWYSGVISQLKIEYYKEEARRHECAIIAELTLCYKDGTSETISTDESWLVAESQLRFCDIYDGEIYDATFTPEFKYNARLSYIDDKTPLIEQEGEKVIEYERIKPISIFKTPRGETVVDFGQNLTGYPEISVSAKKGEVVSLSFAEVMDIDGNFYNQNYRSAQCLYRYICKDGFQTHKPNLTFYGFRYIRIDKFPECDITPDMFTAIVVHSELRRTGNIETSEPLLNQLFKNIIWGQKGNFLDIPTDCPQRDERKGWLGDAQVFCKTASYNFDVYKFFKKWLADIRATQREDGYIMGVAPLLDICPIMGSAAWSDAITIIPWQMYQTYGKTEILKENFGAMKKYIDYITNTTETKYLWTGANHFGDWLELEADARPAERVCKGLTDTHLLASAFYAKSTELLCKTGEVLGIDVSEYKELYKNIVRTFRETYDGKYKTQGEFVLALYFGLCADREKTAREFLDKLHADGDKLQTGFASTPYLLHLLSDLGENELAYKLLLRREYPSWLYQVTKGATTMWEHWDGIHEDGSFWFNDMNSFNHYAYGAVADWMYEVAAGIKPLKPGFEEIRFAPTPTDKMDSFYAEIETKFGKAASRWWHENGEIKYEITTPTDAIALINGKEIQLKKGTYLF